MWKHLRQTPPAVRPAPRINGLSAALAVLLALFAAESAGAQYLHARLQNRERSLHTVSVLPPRVGLMRDGMKGPEPMIEEAEQIGAEIAELVEAALREKQLDVLPKGPTNAASGPDGQEFIYALADVQNQYDKLGGLLNKKPKDVRKGRFSLGDGVALLDPDARTDALVFIRANGSKLTKGKQFYGMMVLGAPTQSAIHVSLAVVDARSGEVLYFAKFEAKGNFVDETRRTLSKPLHKALRELPVALPQAR